MPAREIIQIQVGEEANQVSLEFWKHVMSPDSHPCVRKVFTCMKKPLFFSMDTCEESSSSTTDSFPKDVTSSSRHTWTGKTEIYHRPNSSFPEWTQSLGLGYEQLSRQFMELKKPGSNKRDLTFAHGYSELFTSENQELCGDSIRKRIECCDSLQGFNLLTNSSTRLSGVALRILEDLSEEYSRKPKVVYDCNESHSSGIALTNSMLFSSKAMDFASMLIDAHVCCQDKELFGLVNEPLARFYHQGLSLGALCSMLVPFRSLKYINMQNGNTSRDTDYAFVCVNGNCEQDDLKMLQNHQLKLDLKKELTSSSSVTLRSSAETGDLLKKLCQIPSKSVVSLYTDLGMEQQDFAECRNKLEDLVGDYRK